MTGCEIAYTGEGGEHQVVNTIYERHVQAQDKTDETAGQKHDWPRKIDPYEFPSAKLEVGPKMATSGPSLFRIASGYVVSHTEDWGVRFVHEWKR